jgi:iron(III) transport system ATP-binding protein
MMTEQGSARQHRAADADVLLRGDGLTKDYAAHRVLDGVQLAVPRSSFLVLLGPSGSGKTTLLRCIAGTERLSGGSLWVDGHEVAGPRLHLPPERRGLSMVFQDYALWPHMTVAENVGFAVRRLGLGAAQRRQRALAMLERVGLADQEAKYPNQLSGGQQQRVALARALVAGTPLLLCDEPLSNLDAHLREQVRVEIATLTRDSGATVVYITHDQQEAFALADEVAVIHQGRILQSGPPEEVYRHPANRFVAQFTGLAGTVSGEVVGRRADGIVLVRTGRATVEAIAVGDQEVGTPVDMLLRADALSFGAPETDRGGLEGVVRDTSFRSGAYDHVVDVAGGARLTGVRSATRVPRGSSVSITVEVTGCMAFGSDEATNPGSDMGHADLPAMAESSPAGVAVATSQVIP